MSRIPGTTFSDDGETSTVWEKANATAHSILLQKFSATTHPPDIKDKTMPEALRQELKGAHIGKVWRAKVGRASRWWYGWSAQEALQKALRAPGSG